MKSNTVVHRLLVRARPQQPSVSIVRAACWLWNNQRSSAPCRTVAVLPQHCSTWQPYSSLPMSQNSNVPSATSPIDFTAAAKIEGEESHIAIISLQPGEMLRAESGAMVFMTEGVVMDTKLNGVSSAFTRMLTGQNVFLTDFHYEGNPGTSGIVCLGTDFPSKILRFSLSDHPDHALICQKGAYLASNPNVNIDVEFTKSLTAGFFGGQGFVLQKISGDSDVLVKGGGTIVRKELKEGETLRVTSGSIVCFESIIKYDVQMIPGIKNVMFGGEGLFMTTLEGPGQVWLQGMPPDRMIAEIARRVPSGGGIGFGIPIPIGGGSGGDVAGGAASIEGAAAAGAASEIGVDSATIAASDAAIESDRAATVASSGVGSSSSIDADSPTALFGDAVASPPVESTEVDSNTQSWETRSDSEPHFGDSNSTSFSTEGTEPNFEDDFSFDDSPPASSDSFNDGELFDDTTSAASSATESVSSEGQSIFRQIWDFFSDQD